MEFSIDRVLLFQSLTEPCRSPRPRQCYENCLQKFIPLTSPVDERRKKEKSNGSSFRGTSYFRRAVGRRTRTEFDREAAGPGWEELVHDDQSYDDTRVGCTRTVYTRQTRSHRHWERYWMMARPTANGAGRSRDTSQWKRKRAGVEKNARTEPYVHTYVAWRERERERRAEGTRKKGLSRKKQARVRSLVRSLLLLLHRCTTDGCILPSFPEPFDGGGEPKNQREETSACVWTWLLSSLSLSPSLLCPPVCRTEERSSRETSKA